MVMSGSLDVLVENIREVCNPDYLVCTELEIAQKRVWRIELWE